MLFGFLLDLKRGLREAQNTLQSLPGDSPSYLFSLFLSTQERKHQRASGLCTPAFLFWAHPASIHRAPTECWWVEGNVTLRDL